MLLELIKPGVFAYDIGANIGTCTQRLIDGGCRVLAVEPQPEMCSEMQKIFYGNENVTILQSAVGNKQGIGTLNINSRNTLSTMSNQWISKSRFKESKWKTKIEVPIVTLDSLIDEYGIPDYIKIDVEGWEHKVILGLTKKVPCISFEFVIEFHQQTINCINTLKDIGYTEFHFPGFTDWINSEEIMSKITYLCSIDNNMWGDLYAR